jgi:hypothetical protein
VDGGWNTDIAVSNIQNLVEHLNLDLYTEVIEWSEMRDFQLALFKSGTPHLDIAQDHAFFATMYHYANKYGIKYILNGGNYSTECIRNPKEWIYYGTDMAFINDVRQQFSVRSMDTYPWSGILYHKAYLRYVKGIQVVRPLNWLPYTKRDAQETLERDYGWKAYPQKHFESRFTRRVQLSSLIVTEQMTRTEALAILSTLPYPEEEMMEDFRFVANKLEIPETELHGYLTMDKKWYFDYKNQGLMFDIGARILRALGLERAIKR